MSLDLVRRLVALMILTLAGLAGTSAQAVSSLVDVTFGEGGVATVAVGSAPFYGSDLARQADGGVVGVGSADRGTGPDVVVFRLTASGQPDTAFGPRFLDAGGSEYGAAVAVQPDGRIVVVGSTSVGSNAAVWRLLPNGAPDPTFGAGGFVPIDSGGHEVGADVAVAPDGRILVVGRTSVGPGGSMTVYRLTASGALDGSFEGDGAYGYGGLGSDEALVVVAQPDGKVVVAGFDTDYLVMAVRRFRSDGSPDPEFGQNGVATVSGTTQVVRALALQPDGALLVGGSATNGADADGVIARLTPAGAVDRTFGGATGVRVDLGGHEAITSLALLPSGQVVATGDTSAGTDAITVVLGSDGAPDEDFGPGGVQRVDGAVDTLASAVAQPDGKFLALGQDGATVTKALVFRFGRVQAQVPQATPTCHGRRATVVGTERKDRLVGTRRADVIVALGGADVVIGLGGDDLVCAGAGNDDVKGGPGKDRLYGETGKDELLGGAGKDRLVGGPDRDVTHQRS